jgi:hypothetical protein
MRANEQSKTRVTATSSAGNGGAERDFMRNLASGVIKTSSIAVLSLLLSSSLNGYRAFAGDLPRPSEFSATLVKGAEPVCKAYVDHLNRAVYVREVDDRQGTRLNNPHCDRGEIADEEKFQQLKRVPLSIEELLRLKPAVYAFLSSPEGIPSSIPSTLAVNPSPPNAPGTDQFRQWTALNAQKNYLFYRFEPRVDIDNDGQPDDVVVWKESGGFCGELDRGGNPRILRTDLLVLDRAGELDVKKTSSITMHPKGPNLAIRNPSDPMHPVEIRDPQYRPIGKTFGVFVFENKTYFDTFYGDGGDLNNKRDGTPNYRETLAVLKSEGRKTRLSCEILIR